MSSFSFAFPRRRPPIRTSLAVEPLENRLLMDCAAISGFVYHDLNHNGIRDPGETPLANTAIELRDTNGQVVGTNTTNGLGFYTFSTDPGTDTTPARQEHTIVFEERTTGGSVQGTAPQFDPTLGTLVSVEVHVDDVLTSVIKVENLENSTATVFSNVTGIAAVAGPSLDIVPTELVLNQSFAATAFDGQIDFAGTSGKDYGKQQAGSERTAILTTPEEIAGYIGTGTVTITERTQSEATATGLANIVLQVNTTVSGRVRIIYNYIPSNCLAEGDYNIVLPNDPSGFIPGLKTSGNIEPIQGSASVNFIQVTLGDTDSAENNFGELKPSRLSGHVFHDANANGTFDQGDQSIAGASVTLTGVDDLGQSVNQVQATLADGSYMFANLRPGIYTLTEAQPIGFLDGNDAIGTQGGVTGNDVLGNIQLGDGVDGTQNNFGEIVIATLSGTVYSDRDRSGTKNNNDTGIPDALVTLTGIDDLGNPVNQTQLTGPNGTFAFMNLRPGTYVISEAQPAGYQDGNDTAGSHGGVAGNDRIAEIRLASGAQATDYNFGEVLAGSGADPDPPPTGPTAPVVPPLFGKQYFLASRVLNG